jgi:hypothetical protein
MYTCIRENNKSDNSFIYIFDNTNNSFEHVYKEKRKGGTKNKSKNKSKKKY